MANASAAPNARRVTHPGLLARTAPAGTHPVILRSARTPGAAAAVQQAPGVIQTNFADASHVVWFVTTDVVPKGSVMTAYIVLPDSQLQLDTLTASADIQPGESFALPNIRVYGDFWPQGLVTYAVIVTVNGTDTQAAADYPVDSSRSYDDLSSVIPQITSATQVLSGTDVIVSLKGVFTSDPAYVAIEDAVAPASALQVSPNEIRVNMSRVPNLSLGYAQDLLVTVGQAGWCDTILYRHIPPPPTR